MWCTTLLFVACSQQQPLPPTLSGNPTSPTTDSVYGTPPDPIPEIPTAPPPPPPGSSASPTGREPRLIWTAARQQTWNRMVAENHLHYQHIRSKCNQTRSGTTPYGDRGIWCTIEYQMTGDVTAARAAWGVASQYITAPPRDANDERESFIENAITFDWLYPALTEAERAAAIAGLNAWGRYALAQGTPANVGGMHTNDSDAMVGYYFGLAAADLATQGMPGHVAWLSQSQTGGPGTLPVGGLQATGTNRNTARNTIAQYAAVLARGGQWIEGSDYDLGTLQLLLLGYEAVRQAVDGADPFPEIRQFAQDAIRFNIAIITNDLNQAVQWGDEEHPRDFRGRLYKRVGVLSLLAGATVGTAESGSALGMIDALMQRYGMSGYLSADPLYGRFYFTYDPYATRASTAPQTTFVAEARGHVIARSGNSIASMMMAPRALVDHELEYLSNFQLYRNGEWAITNPLGYNGPAVQGEGSNGLLVAGLSSMHVKGPTRVSSGTNWWAVTGATSGNYYQPSFWDPPATFLTQWERTVVYLQRNGVDHFITVDRLQMENPQSLPKMDRYYPDDRTRIQNARGLVEWIIHAPVAPQGGGNRWTWSTPGGQPVVVTALGPAPTPHVINEAQLWSGFWNFQASELKHQLRLVPQFTGGSTVLRHVVSVGASNPSITVNGDVITIGSTQVTVTATGVQVSG